MHLIHSLTSLHRQPTDRRRVIAIGVFDGLHIGHQAIINATVERAASSEASATVFTFEPMPREFFDRDDPPPRLTRFRERFELLADYRVDEMFCPRFDAVRRLSAQEFVDSLLVDGLSARAVVVGDDFKFGADRGGNIDTLARAGAVRGFDLLVVPPVEWDGERISSTAIRSALQRGDLPRARAMLGRDYSIAGRVVHGAGLGKQFGFPTANVNLKRRLAPVDGIFAVRVGGLGDGLHDAVASVGTRPTIGGGIPLLEVNLFDFDRQIYGQQIVVHFITRLREERKFATIEAMKAQMRLDVEAARAALAA